MNRFNLNRMFFFLLAIALSPSLRAQSLSPRNSDESSSISREPASYPETKKSLATEGLPQSEEEPSRLWNSPWRKSTADNGFDFDFFVFWDGISNEYGGAKKGSAGFLTTDIYLKFDLEKEFGFSGYSSLIQLHANTNQTIGVYPGDVAGINAFAMPNEEILIPSQAYLKKESTENRWSFLLGLYDFSTEFFYTDSSIIFLNNGFTQGAETNPPSPYTISVYPINGPGLRFKKMFENSSYIMAGVSSSQARDPNYDRGTHPILSTDREGTYQIVEAGLQKEVEKTIFNKYFIGYWWLSKSSPILDNEEANDFSKGMYLMGDHHFSEKTSLFARWGFANEKVSRISSSFSFGINQKSIFNEKDQFGVGYSYSALSKKSRELQEDEDVIVSLKEKEEVIEVLYRHEFKPGLVLMPDFQYVINPSMDSRMKPASVYSLHLEISI